MKKIIFTLIILFVFVSVFTLFKTNKANANSAMFMNMGLRIFSLFSPSFAGQINQLESTEIANLEDAGYDCPMDGSTIQISPSFGENTTFFIPLGLEPKSKRTLETERNIIGKFDGEKPIICRKCEKNKDGDEKCVEEDFNLPIITLFSI